MDTKKRIKKINKRLGLLFGFIYGHPRFAWISSEDLKFPMPAGERESEAGIHFVSRDCTLENQVDGPQRWVLAVRHQPKSESEWKEQFDPIPFPGTGYYTCSDIILPPGAEPDDSLTDEVIGLIRSALEATDSDKRDKINALATADDKENQRVISDTVDDSISAFGNIPGKRGGDVSFGGI